MLKEHVAETYRLSVQYVIDVVRNHIERLWKNMSTDQDGYFSTYICLDDRNAQSSCAKRRAIGEVFPPDMVEKLHTRPEMEVRLKRLAAEVRMRDESLVLNLTKGDGIMRSDKSCYLRVRWRVDRSDVMESYWS